MSTADFIFSAVDPPCGMVSIMGCGFSKGRGGYEDRGVDEYDSVRIGRLPTTFFTKITKDWRRGLQNITASRRLRRPSGFTEQERLGGSVFAKSGRAARTEKSFYRMPGRPFCTFTLLCTSSNEVFWMGIRDLCFAYCAEYRSFHISIKIQRNSRNAHQKNKQVLMPGERIPWEASCLCFGTAGYECLASPEKKRIRLLLPAVGYMCAPSLAAQALCVSSLT